MTGRPRVELPEADQRLAIELAAEGKTRREILERLDVSSSYFSNYRARNKAFDEKFARAEQDGLELMADDLKTMHETHADVQRGRLASDNAKFLLSKRIPHVYGDRVDVNLNERVDVNGALLEARKRAMPQPECNPALPDNSQDAEYYEVMDDGTHGYEPRDQRSAGDDPPPPSLDDLLQ